MPIDDRAAALRRAADLGLAYLASLDERQADADASVESILRALRA